MITSNSILHAAQTTPNFKYVKISTRTCIVVLEFQLYNEKRKTPYKIRFHKFAKDEAFRTPFKDFCGRMAFNRYLKSLEKLVCFLGNLALFRCTFFS